MERMLMISRYTARINHLNHEYYLSKVLTEITIIEIFDIEVFRKFLPWNIDLT